MWSSDTPFLPERRYRVQYHFVLVYAIDVGVTMKTLDRITFNSEVMGRKGINERSKNSK